MWGVLNQRAIRGWSECGIVTRLLLTSDRLLVLKHPLLLSIIKIIESGLEVLPKQEASAVCSARRKSDCLSCISFPLGSYSIWHYFFHSYICNLILIFIHPSDICWLLSLAHPSKLTWLMSKFLTYETLIITYICNPINYLHLSYPWLLAYGRKSITIYIWKWHPYLHL